MAKGKKFNAAEKHFEEKCVEWRQQIRAIELENKEIRRKYYAIQEENEKLIKRNEQLEKEMETIAEVKDMSVEDIKVLIASKKRANELASMFGVITGMSRRY